MPVILWPGDNNFSRKTSNAADFLNNRLVGYPLPDRGFEIDLGEARACHLRIHGLRTAWR